MKVFITGATGYIGFNVAKAMRRAGYKVYGLTRSQSKAEMLAKAEIHPVIGDMDNPDSYREIAKQCSILIHAAVDYQHDTVELYKKLFKLLLIPVQMARSLKNLFIQVDVGYMVIPVMSPLMKLILLKR